MWRVLHYSNMAWTMQDTREFFIDKYFNDRLPKYSTWADAMNAVKRYYTRGTTPCRTHVVKVPG